MSDAHPHHEDVPHEMHEGPIKTPKQLIFAVFFAFVIPIIVIILLVMFVGADKRPAAGSDLLNPQATVDRIRPVGSVEVKDISDPSTMKSGEQVYAAVCTSCHGTGTLNAPKLGDAAAWGPRLPQGFEQLLAHALKGKGAMPAQGGGDFSDLEIARAVVFMGNKAGGKFEEPKVGTQTPAASTEPAASTTASAAPSTTAVATTSGTAATTTPAATTTAATPTTGAVPALYTQTCSACHAAGVANAPKIGDKAAWAPRLAQGVDGLTANVVKGKGAMPPKGGSNASEADIKAVVTYMVSQAK